jgi:hypothetical protein
MIPDATKKIKHTIVIKAIMYCMLFLFAGYLIKIADRKNIEKQEVYDSAYDAYIKSSEKLI